MPLINGRFMTSARAWQAVRPGRVWPFMQSQQPALQSRPSSGPQCGVVARGIFDMFGRPEPKFLDESECPPGTDVPLANAPAKDAKHFVKDTPLWGPWPDGMEEVMLGMGCFWCTENLYMKMEGIYSTQVGYAGGFTKNPSYQDICTGRTNHNEVARIIYDPKVVSLRDLLKIFWERHDPTTKFQQGNDMGTQYRSGIYYYTDAQKAVAEQTMEEYTKALEAGGVTKPISTEILPAPKFWMAEEYHQQYDAKPGSRQYCGLSPTGVTLPSGVQEPLEDALQKR